MSSAEELIRILEGADENEDFESDDDIQFEQQTTRPELDEGGQRYVDWGGGGSCTTSCTSFDGVGGFRSEPGVDWGGGVKSDSPGWSNINSASYVWISDGEQGSEGRGSCGSGSSVGWDSDNGKGTSIQARPIYGIDVEVGGSFSKPAECGCTPRSLGRVVSPSEARREDPRCPVKKGVLQNLVGLWTKVYDLCGPVFLWNVALSMFVLGNYVKYHWPWRKGQDKDGMTWIAGTIPDGGGSSQPSGCPCPKYYYETKC